MGNEPHGEPLQRMPSSGSCQHPAWTCQAGPRVTRVHSGTQSKGCHSQATSRQAACLSFVPPPQQARELSGTPHYFPVTTAETAVTVVAQAGTAPGRPARWGARGVGTEQRGYLEARSPAAEGLRGRPSPRPSTCAQRWPTPACRGHL